MTSISQLALDASRYVKQFYADHFSEKFCYHNIAHTEDVVEAVQEIGMGCQLDEYSLQLITIAAWFHDAGYYKDGKTHELISAQLAEQYLKGKLTGEEITKVKNCIMATKVPQTPHSLLEEVMCDADLYHLSTEKFLDNTRLLYEEMSNEQIVISELDWLKQSYRFVKEHTYFTDYAKKILLPQKKKNLVELSALIESYQ